MIETCIVLARNVLDMRKTGSSLGRTLYRRPLSIVLRGDLGAGKTTFVQGFAEGLGVQDHVTSPTYALEQRYSDTLSHIDLYRLNPTQASQFFHTLDPFPGIRIIEWSDRTSGIDPHIEIDIAEENDGRRITIAFKDVPMPDENTVEQWMDDVALPPHIRKHARTVAKVCDMAADALLGQGRLVRKKALHTAALAHDLLRYVDFKGWKGDAVYTPTDEDVTTWAAYKEKYGVPHEAAAQKFLEEHGFTDIGTIVGTHRGHGHNIVPNTVEQFALAYADKRVIDDSIVTLDARFDDFIVRYGAGKESDASREWRMAMKRMEEYLFPEGVPF